MTMIANCGFDKLNHRADIKTALVTCAYADAKTAKG